jgi:hypothetical protein
MERQRGIRMPRIEYGNEYHTECRIGDDRNRDLEGELNLLRPIKFNPKFEYKERDYWLTSDSTTVKPAALFIGNSFLLRTMAYIPPKEVFSDFQFWYYNRIAYENADKIIDSVSNFNRLDYLLDADYIVWFSSSSQMYRATEGFAEDAILQLCIGEERFRQRRDEVADSLKLQPSEVEMMMRKNPEAYFREIAGDSIPTARNPKLLEEDYWKKREIRRQIKRNDDWMMKIASFMVTEDITLQQAIDQETDNVFFGRPLMRYNRVGAKEYRDILIRQTEQQIRNYPEWFETVKADAERRGITVDEAVRGHATYTVDQQILKGKVTLPETETKPQGNP